ncbi:MAG TPA: metallophosphoesterase family protein [Candidatus Sumerlaeota bacterium]|nr:metallophosphoesterase family protein [Candidatus Sumerlaeota bacterium]
MADLLRYGVLSDTHGRISPHVFQIFEGVQRIYHCGDIGSRAIALELEAVAPLHAVTGNMDSWELVHLFPENRVEKAEFGTVVLSHGTHYSHSNSRIAHGLLTQFADENPRLILFGHSHAPYLEEIAGTLMLNPGSASLPHSDNPGTVALVEYDPASGKLSARHVTLP